MRQFVAQNCAQLNERHILWLCVDLFFTTVYFNQHIWQLCFRLHKRNYSKKVESALFCETKIVIPRYVENTKNHVCCEIFYPRDVCLIHLSKTIFCACFGVKLSEKTSSGIMLVLRCYAACAMLGAAQCYQTRLYMSMSVFSRDQQE